mmetsp:Transcript_16583/g.38829  ORF Transcript_16583/g.38829 Transcript_16583/m.38829 type:complete len:201 (-) Transcript_16583:1312-1914(-)
MWPQMTTWPLLIRSAVSRYPSPSSFLLCLRKQGRWSCRRSCATRRRIGTEPRMLRSASGTRTTLARCSTRIALPPSPRLACTCTTADLATQQPVVGPQMTSISEPLVQCSQSTGSCASTWMALSPSPSALTTTGSRCQQHPHRPSGPARRRRPATTSTSKFLGTCLVRSYPAPGCPKETERPMMRSECWRCWRSPPSTIS